MTWRFDSVEIGMILEGHGFDLEPTATRLRAGFGIVSARRDRGDHVVRIEVDAGGQVRATSTTRSDRASGPVRLPTGLTLSSVSVVIHEETLVGRLRGASDLPALIESLARPDR